MSAVSAAETGDGSQINGDTEGDTVDDDDDEPLDPLPWHFKLLVGAITVYLGYRAFQGIEWLVHQV